MKKINILYPKRELKPNFNRIIHLHLIVNYILFYLLIYNNMVAVYSICSLSDLLHSFRPQIRSSFQTLKKSPIQDSFYFINSLQFLLPYFSGLSKFCVCSCCYCCLRVILRNIFLYLTVRQEIVKCKSILFIRISIHSF